MKNEETRETRLMYLLTTFFFTKRFDSLAEGGIINDENVSSRIEKSSGDVFTFIYEVLTSEYGVENVEEDLYEVILEFLYAYGFSDKINASFQERAEKSAKFLISLYEMYKNNKDTVNYMVVVLASTHFNSSEELQALGEFIRKYLNKMSIADLTVLESQVVN